MASRRRSVYPRETVTRPTLTRPELNITTRHVSYAIESYKDTLHAFRGIRAGGAAGPGDGAHLSMPFTGSISFAAPSVSSSGIPNSPVTVLPAGQPVTATITITNTGNSRKDFFADDG
jgi:hypothetical protein